MPIIIKYLLSQLMCFCALQNSLLKLEDVQQCLECSEQALNEALQQLTSAPHGTPPTKEEWVCTIRKLLDGIEVCFTKDSQLLSNFPHFSSLSRLANNLIQVRAALDSYTSAGEKVQMQCVFLLAD